MTAIISSDLHFDNKPLNADRWNLWPWLRDQIRRLNAEHCILLGDITDAKDCHPSELVNRLVYEVDETAKLCELIILRANHDCIDEDSPFFAFLQRLGNRIQFINKPTERKIDNYPCLFLPHTRDYKTAWAGLNFIPYDYIFVHQTFDGSIVENGTAMTGGVPPSVFAKTKAQVISGDIHVPQKVSKNILHVGAPYRVHFGDAFEPRVLLLTDGKLKNLYFPSVGRESISIRRVEDLEAVKFDKGTQVKIKVTLKRSEYPEWAEIRKQIKQIVAQRNWQSCGLELEQMKTKPTKNESEPNTHGTTPKFVVQEYIKRKKLKGDLATKGLSFVEQVS